MVKVILHFVFAYGHSMSVCEKRLEQEKAKENPDQHLVRALERTLADAPRFHNDRPPIYQSYVDTHIMWRCQKEEEIDDIDVLSNLYIGGKIIVGLQGMYDGVWEETLVPVVNVNPPPRHGVAVHKIEAQLNPSLALSPKGSRVFPMRVGGCGCNVDAHKVAEMLVETKGWTLERIN